MNLITPLKKYPIISKLLNIDLYVKHDDLYSFPGGGSKARKINYILNHDVRKRYNAIVSAGGNQSNHLRVVALNAAMLGWKSIAIIHDIKPKNFDGNLKITNLAGAELRFVKKNEVKFAMDQAMIELKNEGYNPLYIWGGGHCVEGAYAFYEAVKETKNQIGENDPDFIFVASGTGTTQAGIEIGIRTFFPRCQVVGVSVARLKNRGEKAIYESMIELNNYLKKEFLKIEKIIFDDDYIGDGYESVYPELIETIKWSAKTEGLILDPTYTGKAFYALKKYIANGAVPKKSKVLFWHTGGLLNLLASKNFLQ